jgi:hypothetical protein
MHHFEIGIGGERGHERPVMRGDCEMAHQSPAAQGVRGAQNPLRGRLIPGAEQEHIRIVVPDAAQRQFDAGSDEGRHARVGLHDQHDVIALARQVAQRTRERAAAQCAPVQVINALLERALDRSGGHAIRRAQAERADAQPRTPEDPWLERHG